MTLRFARVSFLDEAMDDLRRLADRSQVMLVEVFRLLKALDASALTPVPLHDYAKTGDLTDCAKIVVELAGEPEHRIVVRDLGGGNFEVSEVVAVEDRAEDLPYLLAGLRLGRLEDPVRRSDAQRRVDRIRRLRDR
ncbi:hypothetical protein FTX61_20790 [Nitriliruptoraceae bacterium ZYF776]|nr:hypothetical protein [Profundirhabdus halotolerans]